MELCVGGACVPSLQCLYIIWQKRCRKRMRRGRVLCEPCSALAGRSELSGLAGQRAVSSDGAPGGLSCRREFGRIGACPRSGRVSGPPALSPAGMRTPKVSHWFGSVECFCREVTPPLSLGYTPSSSFSDNVNGIHVLLVWSVSSFNYLILLCSVYSFVSALMHSIFLRLWNK